MVQLQRIGKDKVINHHRDVPCKVLNKTYSFGEQNSGNMIIRGDNLEALRALMPRYKGNIDIIYIDPPYNTGKKDEWKYNDNVDDPVIRKRLTQVVGNEAEDFSRHDKRLCMMYPRLKLLRDLLSPKGVIFISIDENELANLKLICDEIFGIGNFVGQWNWFKSATPPNLSNKVKRNIEYILAYERKKNNVKYTGLKKISKSTDPITKPQNSIKVLKFPIGSLNVKAEDGIIKAGIYGTKDYPNELLNDMKVINGKNVNEVSFKNRFTWEQQYLEKQLENDTEMFYSKNGVISYKKAEYDPEVPPNLIDESVGVGTTEEAGKLLEQIFGEKKVFEYPKDPALIAYLINFIGNKNSVILDSFAGSGTTAHAVLEMNKKDGGNRKFILVELKDYADEITAERVKRVINGYNYKGEEINEIAGIGITPKKLVKGKEMINNFEKIVEENLDKYDNVKTIIQDNCLKVVGIKKYNGHKEGTGGGFDFYDIGEPIFIGKDLNPALDEKYLREYIRYSETQSNIQENSNGNKYYLGSHYNIDYYFYYLPGETTSLDYKFLSTIEQKNETTVIYADSCLIDEDVLHEKNIIFKKIPRDISKF